jgi:hypothetical protein
MTPEHCLTLIIETIRALKMVPSDLAPKCAKSTNAGTSRMWRNHYI